jgi:hypothetical protein
MSPTIERDPEGEDGFAAATASAAALLDTAATQADIAATSDLSGLGLLGHGFVNAIVTALQTQSATVGLSRDLLRTYGATVVAQGAALTEVDQSNAGALADATEV